MQTKTFARFFSSATLIVLVIAANLAAYSSTAAAASLTFTPVADAYVIATSPDGNYGTSASLRMDNSPVTRSYIRFNVSGLSGGVVQSVKLRIYANSSNGTGYTVSTQADHTWEENTITYNNSPAVGDALGVSPSLKSGAWTEVDVSSYIQTDGTYDLALTTTSNTNTSLASRESGAKAPQLVIATGSPSSTSSPTATQKSANTPTPTATASQGQDVTFTPVADTYVSADSKSTNYGNTTAIRMDDSPVRNGYLRFMVQGLGGKGISQARLLLYATSSISQSLDVHRVADNSWDEMSMTYSNAPTLGSTVASVPKILSGTWITWDVTSYVTGEGPFSFGLTTPSNSSVSFNSRESGKMPQLIVTLNGTPAATQTPGPTPTWTTTPTPGASPTNTPVTNGDPVLVGAGDISSCSSNGDETTAKLIDNIAGTVFTAGDNAYDSGTASEYANCYDPTWGRFKNRTKPAPGNHEYETSGASGYYGYFGAAAGDPSKGYYSYNLGAWHIVALNSEVSTATGSAQENWLRQDLAANPTACTLAYWHKPRFSSGEHGNTVSMQPLWQALYDYHAEVVINGHDHDYERFEPQSPTGTADANGIREFVVGTGGRSHYGFGSIRPNSAARNSDTFGVLKLTLHINSFDWQFIPEAGKTYTDLGTAQCTP
jgi:acid phosphatase type 7